MPILFIIYLFLELYLIIELGASFGAFAIFLEMIFSAVVGGMILLNFSNTSRELLQKVAKREIRQEEFVTLSLFRVVGAVLLILPGILTDVIGVLLQIGTISSFFAGRIAKRPTTQKRENKNQDVIDVEVIG